VAEKRFDGGDAGCNYSKLVFYACPIIGRNYRPCSLLLAVEV